MLTFSQNLTQVVESLHKFTLTYPVLITTLHADHVIAARDGNIITQPFTEPARIWSGEMATRAAAWRMWNPGQPLAAVATSWL
jgi:hypothetical protein